MSIHRHPREMMCLKANSGINLGGGSGKTSDVTYEHIRTYETSRDAKGQSHTKVVVNNDAYRAIAQASPGTKITVEYVGLGVFAINHYQIEGAVSGNKRLVLMDEQGRRKHRGYVIHSVSDVKKHINPGSVSKITIHGRDLRAEAREEARERKEFDKWFKSQSKKK